MNELSKTKYSFILNTKNFVKENIRIIVSILAIIFFIYLCLQLFSYLKISNIKKDSIVFFDTLDLNDEEKLYKDLEPFLNKENFYSILSSLKLINIDLKNNNHEEAKKKYIDILNKKNIDSDFKSIISANAAYNFLNIQFNNISLNYIDQINYFIELIDDNKLNYKSIKYELEYLIKILKLEKSNKDYKNDNSIFDLVDEILNSNDVSSNIKDRVKKIHDFQIHK